jgi:hypothetical protein
MLSMADPECKMIFSMVDEFNNKSLTHGCYNYIKFTWDDEIFQEFIAIWKKNSEKRIFRHKVPEKNLHQTFKKSENLPRITTACNMKGCLRFFYSHILNTTKFG